MQKVVVCYTQDPVDRRWLAELEGFSWAHTSGTSVVEVRERLREVLELVFEVAVEELEVEERFP